jgi:renalase
MIKDFIVIGAGLSGLHISSEIKKMGLGEVLVLEKSRGIGGRMATRRTLNTKFDHGAQFYRVKADITKLHHLWSQKGISHQWFVSIKGNHWCSRLGMTALAKTLAEGIDVELEKQVSSIQFENRLWKITSDRGEVWLCKKLIITSPLPQSLKLLENIINNQVADLDAVNDIKKINYTKAVIGLITLEEDVVNEISGYEEFQSGSFFSIANQKTKGVSETPAFTVTMSPTFSEEVFEQSDDLTLEKILKEFTAKYPEAKVVSSELKKWRYCQPTSQYKKYFSEIAPNVFLIGDAFGGSSLLGAVRSSEALFEYLLKGQNE